MRSFITRFAEYGATRSDCPIDFLYQAAISTLAAALGNTVSTWAWDGETRPSLFTMLIAPSGWGKSAPINLAHLLLSRRARLTWDDGSVSYRTFMDRIYEGSGSLQAIQRMVSDEPAFTFLIGEFTEFLSVMQEDHNRGFEPWLTRIWDNPEEWAKRLESRDKEGNTRSYTIERPAVNILAATNPEWFTEAIKGTALRRGFYSRFLYLPADERGAGLETVPGEHNWRAVDQLTEHLHYAGSAPGIFQFETDTLNKMFADWNKDYRLGIDKKDPNLHGMYSRVGVHTLKLMMIFARARDPQTLVFTPADFDLAREYMTDMMQRSERFLLHDMAHNEAEENVKRLVNYVVRNGGRAMHSKALQDTHIGKASAFAEVARTAIEMGHLEVETGRYNATWYVIPQRRFLRLVQERETS